MNRRTLTGLRPQAYEHPSDSAALNALTHTAGLDTLIRKLNGWGFERFLRIQLTGSYLRATPDSFADLHDLLKTACATLDTPFLPELYLGGAGGLNAFTAGVEKPVIFLYSAIDRRGFQPGRIGLRHWSRSRPNQERSRPLLSSCAISSGDRRSFVRHYSGHRRPAQRGTSGCFVALAENQ